MLCWNRVNIFSLVFRESERQGERQPPSTAFLWFAGLLVAAFFSASIATADENTVFHRFPPPSGNTFEHIRDIVTDDDGAIWIALWGQGVCRIDKADVRFFQESDGLPSNWTRGITPDRMGGAWVATSRGVCHIHHGKVTVPPQPIPEQQFYDAFLASDNRLWVSTEQGHIYSAQLTSGQAATSIVSAKIEWHHDTVGKLTGDAEIRDFFEDSRGRLWAASDPLSVLYLDDKTWVQCDSPAEQGKFDHGFYEDSQGVLYLASHHRCYRFEGERWIEIFRFPQYVRCVCETLDGNLCVGTDAGVRVLHGEDWVEYDLGRDIGLPRVTAMLKTSGERLWLGSKYGLYCGTLNQFRQYSTPVDGHSLIPKFFRAAPTQAPLMINAENDVMRFNGRQWDFAFTMPTRGKAWSPKRLYGKNAVWTLTEDKLSLYSLDDGTPLRTLPRPVGVAEKYTVILESADDNLWFVNASGIHAQQGAQWKLLTDGSQIPQWGKLKIRNAVADNAGLIHICHDSGIIQWDGTSARELGDLFPEIIGKAFRGACLTQDGTLWFGSRGGGIFIYNGKSIRQITTDDGLASNLVDEIFQATDGSIWIAYRWKGAAVHHNGQWINFNHLSGLPERSVIGIGEHPPKTIWLALQDSGVFRYEPDRDGPETWIEAAPEVMVPDGIGVFSVSAKDAWNRTQQNQLRYSWRISPEESQQEVQWSSFSPQTTIVTPRLGPGSYTLQVTARDQDNNIDETPAEFPLVVAPYLWQRVEFQSIVLVLVVVAGFSFRQHQRNRQVAQQRQTLLERIASGRPLNQLLGDIAIYTERVLPGTLCSIVVLEKARRQLSVGAAPRFPTALTEAINVVEIGPDINVSGIPGHQGVVSSADDTGTDQLTQMCQELALQHGLGMCWSNAVRNSDGQTIGIFSLYHRGGYQLPQKRLGEINALAHLAGIAIERHNSVNDLQQLNLELEDRVCERTSQLSKVNRQLRDEVAMRIETEKEIRQLDQQVQHAGRVSIMGQMVAGIAHELNQPLTSIAHYANGCRRRLENGAFDAERFSQVTGEIASEAVRAGEIIRGIRQFVTKNEIDRDEVHFKDVLNDALHLAMYSLRKQKVDVSTSVEGDLQPLYGNHVQLSQVVLNLILNAAEAMKETDASNRRLSIKAHAREKGIVQVEISDSGPGVAEEVRETLFQEFSTTKSNGMGMGLAICSSIIASHGGTIWVDSSPKCGTTFKFRLPIALEGEENQAAVPLQNSSDNT